MQYQVILTPRFEKDIKYYSKKYRKIYDDVKGVVEKLEQGILIGDSLVDLHLPDDESVYKVRVANTSARIGASGGFRIIYYAIKNDQEIFLLTIYSKSDQENIKAREIEDLIKMYCQ